MKNSVTDQLPTTLTDTVTGTLVSVGDTVRTTVDVIDLGDMADTLGDAATVVIDSAGDLVGAAGDVSVQGGRVVVRGLRAGGRTVRRHPKVSLGLLALLLAAFAGMSYASKRKAADDAAPLKVAA